MDHDTQIGGRRDRFPQTHRSAVMAVRSDDPQIRERALGALIETYWKPVYKYIRLKWSAPNEEAKDFTQGFFVEAFERGLFGRYEPALAAFRTYLRKCVDGFVANERKAAQRQKRGGDRRFVSLDFEAVETEFRDHVTAESPEAMFDREWTRSLFRIALERLQGLCDSNGKEAHFGLFQRYDVADSVNEKRPTYDQLAAEFRIPTTQVTNHLAWARREFRRLVLDTLREITAGEEEFREEASRLLGIDER